MPGSVSHLPELLVSTQPMPRLVPVHVPDGAAVAQVEEANQMIIEKFASRLGSNAYKVCPSVTPPFHIHTWPCRAYAEARLPPCLQTM